MRTIGIEGVRVGVGLLAVAFVACVVMAGRALWTGPAQDVPRGVGPAVPAVFALWAVLAIVAGTAAVLLWSWLPERSLDEDGLDA